MKDDEKLRLKAYFSDGDPDDIFILEEEIASGSFGAVYKGRHADSGEYYAVKIITPEEDEVLEDFMVEISILRKCLHKNIVGFFGSWMKGEELFIAMELCDGGAVSDIFNICNEGLTEDQIAVVTRETLKALSYLHGSNIIHRDIKGANILLNNNGDIKLVDFGVSAELKQASDKRNTLIGTPYWMAPEVIANKTGNVPYNAAADIWSLGITIIELAEMNPPLHEIHPMKALMMIPMRESPTFTHPDRWSRELRDFVTICLQKSPEKRKTADELMKHPFVSGARDNSVLVELIQKRRKAETADASNSDDDDDDSDYSEEEGSTESPRGNSPPGTAKNGKTSLPLPVMQVYHEQFGSSMDSTPGSSPGGTPRNPFHLQNNASTSSPDVTPRQSLNVPGSKGSPAQGSGASTPEVHRKPSSGAPKPAKSTMNRPTNNPNRPTYRTNKKMTKRDIKNHEKNLINRQLLKEQLKEIRRNQAKHSKQIETQNTKQVKEKESLVGKYEAGKQQRLRSSQRDFENLVKRHKTERELFEKQAQSSQRALAKQHQTTLKQTMKVTETDAKSEHKQFQESIKSQTKELKEKNKTLSKKEYKTFKMTRENDVEWQELVFQHKQARTRFIEEYGKKQELQEEHHKYEIEQLGKKHFMQWDHLSQQQKFQVEALSQSQGAALEYLQQMHPMEDRHLQERHDLAKQQVNEQQQTERDQQNKLLISELKGQLREHRKNQQTEQLDLQNQLKSIAKDKNLGKPQQKAKQQELKDQLASKQQKDTQEFEEKQAKQRAEEEEMIRKHQAAKQEQQRFDQEEEVKKLTVEHEEQLRKLNEEHSQQTAELVQKHQAEELELLQELQNDEKALRSEHYKGLEQLLLEYQADTQKLYEAQHQEQLKIREKHKKEADTVMQEHGEERNILKKKQENEVEILNKQNSMDADVLNKHLEQARRQLEDIHKTGALRRFQYPAEGTSN